MLGNLPLSPRLRTLLLARNRIAALADLDVRGRFAGLTHLVLVDNPVTKKEVGQPPRGKGKWERAGWADETE